MAIQCKCLDVMRAEDVKLHFQLEWPNASDVLLVNFEVTRPMTSKIQFHHC